MTAPVLKFVHDESAPGDRRKGDFYAVAGVFATLRQWRSFEAEWRSALRSEKSIEYFKMSEAVRMKGGQFDRRDGWTVPLVRAKVEALTRVIRACTLGHTITIVPLRHWRDAMRPCSFPLEYEDPYLFCFVKSVQHVAFIMNHREGRRARPRVVFDEQTRFVKKCCGELWDNFRETPETRDIGRWLGPQPLWHEDKSQEIGIQAADLIAWHYRTLPWERQFKKHRRRRFISQIDGHPCAGLSVHRENALAWAKFMRAFVKDRKANTGAV